MSFEDAAIHNLFIRGHLKLVQGISKDVFSIQSAKELVLETGLFQDLDENHDNYHDELLPRLLSWFANEFFRWFEPPACEKCSGHLSSQKSYVNQEGRNVEVYECDNDKCEYKYEFIRHNDLAILLSTRQGRCGEWANCFFGILLAMGYDARIIFDSTDHCWNEVWSTSRDRWIHVDPCEQAIDKPLLYEVGWSKKLEYCVAFSQFEVLDVTRRYTAKNDELLARRVVCDDEWLNDYLQNITESLMSSIESEDDRVRVIWRRLVDIDFLQNPDKHSKNPPDPNEFTCRKTGSIQWRISRGEYTPCSTSLVVIKAPEQKEPFESGELFCLKYNCDKNLYTSSALEYNKSNWSSLTYSYLNLDHKYERDWKTSYMSRYETCPFDESGEVVWRLDLTELKEEWSKLEIKLTAKIYPGTSVELSLSGPDVAADETQMQSLTLEINKTNLIERIRIPGGSRAISLKAKMSGGSPDDSVAWQKPQLFRQTRGQNSDEDVFVLRVLA